ncbi:MAG: DNA polymerase III subunit alpha [Burkholderiales bacterium]|nr:DNA polymerase III subunit alpha [Burkholderiales bacterium]OJX07563.1 MAG: DNA polymerase III subunit alpha [Burkholderiales bacterium 70-64]
MNAPRFVHLRVHSEYSVSDSIVRIDALIDAAHRDAQPAVAVTDLANLFGWVRFYKAARARGIKPVCGVDAWFSNAADRDRPFRLLLLARDRTGYLRLCELISRAWLENEYRGRGEMCAEWFDEPHPDGGMPGDGLIALSGAQAGDVGQALLAGNATAAAQLAQSWARRFPDAFYLEVQRSGQPEAEAQTRAAAHLAARLGLPIVATHPVQFLGREEFRAHEARVCIAEGEILANPRRVRRFTEEQYFRSQEEMAQAFADLPSALANSVEIARRCNVSMVLGKPQLPQFPTPEGVGLDDYMRRLAHEGLEQRMQVLFPPETTPADVLAARHEQYRARLEYECDTIVQMGFSGYFLIVADFINWAKKNGVPVGPGRGSGAGSLVAFALGITDLDPIPYALLFERFLNPERVSMPDFDIDFCQDNRWKVIEYVRSRYGEQAVSQIATFGTMASKAVIRDVGRVLDMGYNFCDQLSKLIPLVQNKPLSLAKAREAEPLLAERERKEDEVRGLLALAEPLEDLTRNVGMHAGGVLIAPGRLTDFCPLYKQPGAEAGVVSQFDKDDVEAVGLVKFDFLGLRNLTIIDLAVDYINRRHPGLGLDLQALAFDDPRAYQVLKEANTTAVFQLESEGMKKLLKKLQPDRFEDIIAVLALYRPGPLGSGMVDDFILRKKGQQQIDYFHPDLTACLEPTYGVIVYQEQVMQIAQIIGGYTLGGADLLRRAMGKKKPEEMAQHRGLFVEGAQRKGYPVELANKLFDLMAMFAEYGFNKSHTAAYAVITYHTAWLKARYPAEFMAATLSSDMDDTDKVKLFVDDARANRVEVLPPDINASGYRFEPVSDSALRYGLGAIKGTGESAVVNILQARAERPFSDLFDFCARIDRKIVNRRAIEALVRAGAFDALEPDRARLLANVGRAIDAAEAAGAAIDQVSLFGDEVGGLPSAPEWIAAPAWSERQRLQEEKVALGLFLSGHLFHACEREVRSFARTRLADLQPAPQPVWIAGIVAAQRTQMTRRGKMVFVTLDDGSATLDVSVFNELYEAHRRLIRDDELLVVLGKVSRDDYTGGQRVVADRLLDLTMARQEFGKRLRIRLNGIADGAALRGAIAPFAVGDRAEVPAIPVVVEYGNGDASCSIELGARWRVQPHEDLMGAIRSALHPLSAAVEYG